MQTFSARYHHLPRSRPAAIVDDRRHFLPTTQRAANRIINPSRPRRSRYCPRVVGHHSHLPLLHTPPFPIVKMYSTRFSQQQQQQQAKQQHQDDDLLKLDLPEKWSTVMRVLCKEIDKIKKN